jgi:hypothetical protein
MIGWDFWKTDSFEFVRSGQGDGNTADAGSVSALMWQWDQWEEARDLQDTGVSRVGIPKQGIVRVILSTINKDPYLLFDFRRVDYCFKRATFLEFLAQASAFRDIHIIPFLKN